MTKAALNTLRTLLDENDIYVGEKLAERDNGYWDSSPLQGIALVTPRSTTQLQAIVNCCRDHQQAIAVQGGQTGTVKAQKPQPHELAISLEKMDTIHDFDPVSKTVIVDAGCTLEQIQQFASKHNLLFPIDIGARGSCTIGGNIATNAGGMEVLRYGMMRHQVLGLEAVLADGTILGAMNQMQKNNAGYDLKQLLIGSEGTLGIVTKAVLQLKTLPESCETAMIACQGFDELSMLLDSAQRALGDILTRFEVMEGNYYNLQTNPGNFQPPLPRNRGWYVIVEVTGFSATQDRQHFQLWLEHLINRDQITDVVIAHNQRQRREIWQIRESFEVGLGGDTYFLYDVSLPITAMPEYLQSIQTKIYAHWPDALFFTLGHMADCNLHFFLSPGIASVTDDQIAELKNLADNIIYVPLQHYSGSVSAEHGIGFDKKQWLPLSRTEVEIKLMKSIKQLFDPNNLLNPGRIFDL